MANKLSVDKKVAAVGMLCEGTSIRSVERVTGIHRDTILAGRSRRVHAAGRSGPAAGRAHRALRR